MPPPAAALRALLSSARSERRCLVMPACHDALSAALIARAGFEVAFMSGYAVSATSLALPDAGLISYGEQVQVARNVCEATRGCGLLVIGDGDTGFGGSGNVRRTVRGYAAAGLAGITIEDQVYPKRCSYARGLAVESRARAVSRVRVAEPSLIARARAYACETMEPSIRSSTWPQATASIPRAAIASVSRLSDARNA